MPITPGPWRIKYKVNVVGPNDRGVASCGGYQSNVEIEHVEEENKANAEAIANLPDLLARYEKLVEAARGIVELWDGNHLIGTGITKLRETLEGENE